jgi:hypothetical protein
MRIVIDAPIIQAYHIEDNDAGGHECSCEVTPLFARLDREDELWLDSGDHILGEWQALVGDEEWFAGWLYVLIATRRVISVPVNDYRELLRRLGRDHGFPHGTGDKWYIRTAATVRDATGDGVVILSEDMHFHDPRSKHLKGAARDRVIRNGTGAMARHLRKSEKIDVRCVERHLGDVDDE